MTTTNKCYRLAIKPSQGIGIVEWGIGGDLPFPESDAGTAKGYGNDNQAISLILDSSSGRFYRVGIKEVWKDKINSYGQGIDIDNMIRIKEHIGVGGESSMVEHIESHIHQRPYDEDYKNQSGYTSAGFLENHSVQLKMFANGDTDTPIAKLKNVNQYADNVFGKRVEAKRLQLQVEMSTAAYRIVKVSQLLQNIDKVTPDDIGGIRTENLYQRMFRGQDLWITRDSKRPLMNRATGLDVSGNYNSLGTGPDGVANSAIVLNSANNINYILSQIASPSTISFWLGNISSGVFVIDIFFGDFTLEFRKGSNISVFIYNTWSSLLGTVQFEWTGAGWALITISSDGNDLFIYENGVLKGIIADPFVTYGNICGLVPYKDVSIYDIRRIPRQIGPEAIQWYYDDVINNEGSGGLLPIMR